MIPANELDEVTRLVAHALHRAGIEYVIGGSVASGLQGEPRATADIDIAVRLSENQIGPLVEALGPDFIVDEEMLREAIRSGRSANIYFLPTVTKIDLFVRGSREFDRSEFARKIAISFSEAEPPVFLASPEDNLLRKLRWFRDGGEVSELQWRDVLGVLRFSRDQLDLQYLRSWAASLDIADLLERALVQAWD